MLIDDFRILLGLGEKYKQNSELKARVTNPAIQQINENTDFELDIAFKKSKRTFKWIQLRFNQKTAAKAAEQEAQKQRETRALRNQAAAQKRKETEQVQAAANKA
ncbi:replication initiation protein, partial [Kingella kingae]|uniref:replication initiation protein n=1 Tax=Kingella kingae TaxID=504 RepID=UPI0032B5A862